MASKALRAAGLTDLDLYTVEVHKCYKPDPEVYKGLCKYSGKGQNPRDCWLVSGYVVMRTIETFFVHLNA